MYPAPYPQGRIPAVPGSAQRVTVVCVLCGQPRARSFFFRVEILNLLNLHAWRFWRFFSRVEIFVSRECCAACRPGAVPGRRGGDAGAALHGAGQSATVTMDDDDVYDIDDDTLTESEGPKEGRRL